MHSIQSVRLVRSPFSPMTNNKHTVKAFLVLKVLLFDQGMSYSAT